MATDGVKPPNVQLNTVMRICNVTTSALDPPSGGSGYVLFRK